MNIPLCRPYFDHTEYWEVFKAMRSEWLTHGPCNEKFEKALREYIGCKHAISVNSATSALFLALVVNNIKGEVILPSFTFSASANAVINAGSKPVFADIEYDTCNIDQHVIPNLITSRTEAIMVVHFAGHPCDMYPIKQICEKHNLLLIEDSAETLGATYDGKFTGTFGIGCFSFFPTKIITTGEGGMITTNDDVMAEKLRRYVAHGIYKNKMCDWKRSARYPGHNLRMSNLNAAIGVAQMKKLDKMVGLRNRNAAWYNEYLNRDFFDIPTVRKYATHCYQMYTVKLMGINRDVFVARLREHGIQASVHFDPPIHTQEYYCWDHGNLHLPVTADVASRIVTLPMYPQLTRNQIKAIATKCNQIAEDMLCYQ